MDTKKLAEQQIRKAQLEGQFDNLKGAGKPLPAEGDGSADAVGYRIMAEAGALPEEMRLKKEVARQQDILSATTDPTDRKRQMAILADLQMRLAICEEARRRFDRT